MANVNLNAVNKVYPSGTVALYNASFTANDNELLVLCGADGSGKSTLLKVIAGLEEATEGKILIGDKDVTEIDVKDRNVAMLFRNNTLTIQQSVYDNLAYGLVKRHVNPTLIDKRVKAVASVFGLEEVLNKKVKMLTTEQKQFVALGRALVREPKVYLFDDPFSGLDESLKKQLIKVVASLQARVDGAFIYATANIAEAITLASRIVVLKEGFIQQIDTPSNLYDYPANEYVAFFVGSPAINFLRNATLVLEEDDVYAVCKNAKIKLDKAVVNRLNKEYINSDKKVTVGLRPEDLSIDSDGELAVKVANVDVWANGFAECDLGDISIIVATQSAKKDAEVKVKVNSQRVYLFDAETTLSILSRDEGYQDTKNADADFVPLAKAEADAIKNKQKPAAVQSKKGKK